MVIHKSGYANGEKLAVHGQQNGQRKGATKSAAGRFTERGNARAEFRSMYKVIPI